MAAKIYGWVLIGLGFIGCIMGFAEGMGVGSLSGLLVSLYGLYLVKGGSLIIW